MKSCFVKYRLHFNFTARTSRETLRTKDTYFIKVWDEERPGCFGIGEAPLFKGLGADDRPGYEEKLLETCTNINTINLDRLEEWSSIKFGFETALNDFYNGGRRTLYDTPFSRGEHGIKINGLVWMGSREEMYLRIKEKLSDGFGCIKLKIGGIDFESELSLIKSIREHYPPDMVELRLDANGAFSAESALKNIESLSRYSIHSLEQPIKAGNYKDMAKICSLSPIPIALDEELIGICSKENKQALLDTVAPQYIIIKPSLAGGFAGSREWIEEAQLRNIKWWATSALESNIGLNAIAQWISTYNLTMPQGLGTGHLYRNNIPSPLRQNGEQLYYSVADSWDLSLLQS